MPVLPFTVRALEALKPDSEKVQVDYWDKSLPSFGIRISQSGRKSWVVMYRFKSRLKRMTLGQFGDHALGLAEARSMAKEILREVAKGNDPAGEKKRDRHAETFGELAELYLAEAKAKKRIRSYAEDKRILESDVLPRWKNLKAKEIIRDDVRSLLKGIVDRGAPIQSNRTHALVRRVFNFAIEEQKASVELNPATSVKRQKEKPKERCLSIGEIRELWSELDKEQSFVMRSIPKMILLTAQRPGEVMNAEWSEIDFETAWWAIPGEKTKNGKPHRVALSPQAMLILSALKKAWPSSSCVFPNDRLKDLTNIGSYQKVMERVRARMNSKSFTAHDLRRTAASHISSMGFSRFIIERILNHSDRTVTQRYDVYDYAREKREAVNAWGKLVELVITTETVTDENVLDLIRDENANQNQRKK